MSRLAPSPQQKAWIDRISVALFAVAWSLAALRFGPRFVSPPPLEFPAAAQTAPAGAASILLATSIGVIVGYLLADLLAGIVHWIADRFFDPETPLLGPMLIAPFREHHRDPLSITRHDFFEVSGNNALVTIPVVVLILLLPDPRSGVSYLVVACGMSLSIALVATNQFHRWAHSPAPPRFARCLHACGLILTPERHAQHHRHAQFDRAYCVTSGWLNPLLDRIHVFDRIERLVARRARAPHDTSGEARQSRRLDPAPLTVPDVPASAAPPPARTPHEIDASPRSGDPARLHE